MEVKAFEGSGRLHCCMNEMMVSTIQIILDAIILKATLIKIFWYFFAVVEISCYGFFVTQ